MLGFNLTKGLVFRTSFNTNIGYAQFNLLSTYLFNWLGNEHNCYFRKWYQPKYLLELEPVSLSTPGNLVNTILGAMVSHEAQASTWKNVGGRRTGFLTNDIFDLNAGNATTASNTGGSGQWAMESYLARFNYNYDNSYLLTGTYRRDGSVNFGPEKRWGAFPSVSAAWRVSQEKFFDVPFISELKVRLETGLTGNQGGGNAAIYSPLAAGASPWGTGFLPSVYPNKALQWEETQTNNIGVKPWHV